MSSNTDIFDQSLVLGEGYPSDNVSCLLGCVSLMFGCFIDATERSFGPVTYERGPGCFPECTAGLLGGGFCGNSEECWVESHLLAARSFSHFQTHTAETSSHICVCFWFPRMLPYSMTEINSIPQHILFPVKSILQQISRFIIEDSP